MSTFNKNFNVNVAGDIIKGKEKKSATAVKGL